MNNIELSEDIEKFYIYINNKNSFQTVRLYKIALGKFISYIKNKNTELNKQSINDWLLTLKDYEYSNTTINIYISALKAYLKYSKQIELINNIEKYIIDIQEPIAMPIIQLKKLLNYCFTALDTLLITILIETGAKMSEIIKLKKEDIIEQDTLLLVKFITIVRKKITTRIIPIKSSWAIDFITNSIQELKIEKSTDYLFTGKSPDSLQYIIKEVARSAGMPFIHPHSFRHTYITELFKKGVTLYQIGKLTGLNPASVRRYLPKETTDEIINFTPEI
jgi:site-specific recombinase XerD